MHRAAPFGKHILCLLLCLILFLSTLTPVSAAMVDLELLPEERTVTAVYRRASLQATVIGRLVDGTEITVTGEKNGFYIIRCGGMKGYIPMNQAEVDNNGIYYVNCSAESRATRTMDGLTDQQHRDTIDTVRSVAAKHLGTPYRYGGTRPGGFDCSGFVLYVYGKAGIKLSRTASQQTACGVMVEKEDLLPGDLVFFQGTGSGAIASHVGIYVGDGMFIHASSSGIRYDALDSAYWSRYYLSARRIVLTGTAAYQHSEIIPENSRSSDIPVGAFSVLLGFIPAHPSSGYEAG